MRLTRVHCTASPISIIRNQSVACFNPTMEHNWVLKVTFNMFVFTSNFGLACSIPFLWHALFSAGC